jgi:hypothetical protein
VFRLLSSEFTEVPIARILEKSFDVRLVRQFGRRGGKDYDHESTPVAEAWVGVFYQTDSISLLVPPFAL